MDSEVSQEGEKLEEMLLRKGLLMPVFQIVNHLQKTAESYGVPIGNISMNYNTRLIQELGLWAQDKGRGAAFQAEGFKAYFVDNENVADTSVLMRLAHRAGLDSAEAKAVIESRCYSNMVDADWEAVRKLEIVAAPTFVIGNNKLVGAQSYENLTKFVLNNGAKKISPALSSTDG